MLIRPGSAIYLILKVLYDKEFSVNPSKKTLM